MSLSERLPALDGVRALAIGLVFMRHSLLPFQNDPASDTKEIMVTLFGNGWLGVDLFFVLSGFLITRSLICHPEQSWRLYLLKRGLRILPAYYAALLLTISGLIPFYEILTNDPLIPLLYHFIFLQDYLPNTLNVAFWSLGVEEKFYLLMPLLFAGLAMPLLNRFGLKITIIAGLILLGFLCRACGLLLFGVPENYLHFLPYFRYPFHACLEPLFTGVLIAMVRYNGPQQVQHYLQRHAKLSFWTGSTLLCAILYGGNRMEQISTFDILFQPGLIALAAGLMVLGAVYDGAPALFRHRISALLARLSFSLYLVHMLGIPFAVVITARSMPDVEFTAFYSVFFLLYSGLSFALALGLYMAVERPGLAIKKRLENPAVFKDAE